MSVRGVDGKTGRNIRRRAIGYIRVSTTGQGEHGISLDAQRDAIEAFADTAGYELLEIFEDTASGRGAASFDKRKGLNSALEFLSRNNDTQMFVWDWDRLSRHADFEQQVRNVGADLDRIVSVKDLTKFQDASSAATFAHKEAEANEISRRTREGMARKRDEEGIRYGNPAILTDVQPAGAKARAKRSEENVRRIAAVLCEFEDPDKLTSSEIADQLNAKGLRTPNGNAWTVQRVRKPLKKARELLDKQEREAMQAHPEYGKF